MKALLINPPADDGVRQVREGRCMQRAGAWTAIWTPLSLAYCAACLREKEVDVRLVDCIIEKLGFDAVESMARDFQPDIVIVNAVTPTIISDISTAEYAKKGNPSTITIAIGIHGSALPAETLAISPSLDMVVMGEPELTVIDVADAIKNRRDLSTINGLCFRSDGKPVINSPRRPLEDLDTLPFPAYDLIKTEKYLLPFSSNRFLLIATGRGCNYPCAFCADHVYYGKKVRVRAPEKVVDEMAFWGSTIGITHFLFWSESFTLNRDYACAVAREIIERGLKIDWICNSRVDNVDDEMMSLFKKAGCSMIGFGIESGSDELLERMKKRITTDQIRNAVIVASRNGIEVVAHTILGFPGETRDSIMKTVKFVKSLNIDYAQFYCAVPFPGSELYIEAKAKGWIATDDWRRFEQNFSVIDSGTIKPDDIEALRKKAYRSFYMRPSIVVKTLKKLYTQGGILRSFSIIKDFATWI